MADDQELWEQICQGNAQVFSAFYCEHAPRLQAFLRQLVGSPQVAEDLMQETFTRIWQRPNGFQPERGTLRAYVYGIARKSAMDWWRRQRPEDARNDDEASAISSPETASVVGDALRRLPEETRTLLWLREVEGQSYAELAEILGVPVGTVRSRLFAARESLRKIWKGAVDAREESV